MASDLSDVSDLSEIDPSEAGGSPVAQATAGQGQVEPVQLRFNAVINSAFLASQEDVEEHGLKLEKVGLAPRKEEVVLWGSRSAGAAAGPNTAAHRKGPRDHSSSSRGPNLGEGQQPTRRRSAASRAPQSDTESRAPSRSRPASAAEQQADGQARQPYLEDRGTRGGQILDASGRSSRGLSGSPGESLQRQAGSGGRKRQQAVEEIKAMLQANPNIARRPGQAAGRDPRLSQPIALPPDEQMSTSFLGQTFVEDGPVSPLPHLGKPKVVDSRGKGARSTVNFAGDTKQPLQEQEVGQGDLTERVRFAPAGELSMSSQVPLVAEEDLMKDFRPSDTLVTVHATASAPVAPAKTMQRSLAPQKYNQATMYPEHATSRRSEKLKATRASLGRTLRSQTLKKAPPELPDKDAVYVAKPFQQENQAAGIATPEAISPNSLLGYHLHRSVKVNWFGTLLFLLYLGALGYYLFVRITQTLGLKPVFLWYGILTLVVECLGAVSVAVYGINHLWDAQFDEVQEDPNAPGLPLVKLPYVIRVLIACYREEVDIAVATVEAAAAAQLPAGCSRFIYLCDDGRDPEKAQYMLAKGAGYIYVAGRIRAQGEVNGKSGNLNNVLEQLYGEQPIPGNEILCILDADMAVKPDFFLRTVPLLDEGDDVAMVLTPQAFHNLDLDTDIFNHSNVHFWQYMQPGADAIGFISCTGTNFLLRSRCAAQAGWFPTYTLTEDYALGIELKKQRFQCRYVRDYLALGEAPHQIRNAMQQRSRWAKGHFQIVYSREHCPLLARQLSWPMRLLYCSAVYSYIVCCISTPFFQMIPVITIWIGIFPLVISDDLALALTILGVATTLLMYRVRTFRHLKALFFANLSNQFMWYAYLKAAWRGLTTTLLSRWFGSMHFKATLKGKSRLEASALSDIWIHCLTAIILSATIACGIWQACNSGSVISPLVISICWAAYGLIPSALLIFYSLAPTGDAFALLCRALTSMYTALGIACISLVWVVRYVSGSQVTGGVEGVGLLFQYVRPISEVA